MEKVLLTGITGYVGSHLAIQLLDQGYEVIGTTRNLERGKEMKEILSAHSKNIDKLSILEANLTDELYIWEEALSGIDYAIHVASPLPRIMPKNDDDLIIPAKKGVLNVLQAAAANGVKRVVLTSSFAAIAYGVSKRKIFTEEDWTDPSNYKDSTAYIRSKAIAEKAAWNFIEKDNSGLELSVVNPGLILGPVLDKRDYGTSAAAVLKMLDGSFPAIPKFGYGIVDVRSVVDMHIKAMTVPKAAGERFICINSFFTMADVINVLREKYPERKFPKMMLPNFVVRIFSLFDKEAAPATVELNAERLHSNEKARKLLNWEPISDRQSIIDTAESLFKLGFIK